MATEKIIVNSDQLTGESGYVLAGKPNPRSSLLPDVLAKDD